MTTKLTAQMRRILGDLYNAGGSAFVANVAAGPVGRNRVKALVTSGHADWVEGTTRVRITDKGSALLGLPPVKPSPITSAELAAALGDKEPPTDPPPAPKKLETRVEARPREARPSRVEFMAAAMEGGANLGEAMKAADAAGLPRTSPEAQLLIRMTEKVERAVAMRKRMTAEDWLELYELTHEARELLTTDRPARDDDPIHPQE